MQESIDRSAFHALTSGLYVISSKNAEGLVCGCVANTLLQVASEPAQMLVSLNKGNATTKAIMESGEFAATVLSQSATMELIGLFGFQSSTDINKFESVDHDLTESGIPCLRECGVASFLIKVEKQIDVVTHIVFIGTVVKAQVLADETPLTYAYYHEVLRGKTPKNAASYDPSEAPVKSDQAAAANATGSGTAGSSTSAGSAESAPTDPAKVGWRCTVCGYIVEGYPDGLPEDFQCPICQIGREFFERVEL